MDSSQQQLKNELKKELREELTNDLEQQVEQEVEEESQEQLAKAMAGPLMFARFRGGMLAFLALIIALGEYSEAVSVIADTVDTVRSEFTHDVEYGTLAQIHVGNTQSYINDLLGSPQVARPVSDNINAHYYYSEKYLLTLFYQQERVSAYTVLPLIEDFQPTIASQATSTEESWNLGVSSFANFPANPQSYLIDHSKTASYYLENLDRGRSGLFLNTYLGRVAYTANTSAEEIAKLYKLEVHGSDDEILKQQTQLRQKALPNLYGRGELAIELIEKSILSGAEISNYFGHL